jgi:DNA-binding XRE family transcriptional regulator
MSWGDHDTDLINKKLNIQSRLENESHHKKTMSDDLFSKHRSENDVKNLGYRDRDWYELGLKDSVKTTYSVTNNSYKNNFSKNLKIIRVSFGFTMDDLHKACGIAIQTIGKYESGSTRHFGPNFNSRYFTNIGK